MAVAAPLVIPIGEALWALGCAAAATLGLVATGAAVEEMQKAKTKSRAEPRVETKTRCIPCERKKRDCDRLIRKLDELLNRPRPPGVQSGTKGLKQRFCEQKNGQFAPSSPAGVRHEIAIMQQQVGAQNVYMQAMLNGCPIPPSLHRDATHFAYRGPISEEEHAFLPGFDTYCYQMAISGRSG